MDNKQIAKIFDEMGNILEIQGEGFFRVNGYRKGVVVIENLAEDLRKVVKEDPKKVEEIPGIGKGLAEKIIELVTTGKCKSYEKLKKDFPMTLLEMLDIRGLGPKKIKLFYDELGIKTVEELKKAAENHLLQELPKMGVKSETEILEAIKERALFSTDRSLIHDAMREAERYKAYMKECPEVEQIEYAGSLRRWQESIGDIDILVGVSEPAKVVEKIMKYFIGYDEVLNVIAEGNTKSSVILNSGIQTDLRVIENKSFGAALHYFTGNKEHNIIIRDIAKNRGLKVNEYGLFDGEKQLAGETEKSMYEALGVPWMPPEIRKGEDEFEYGVKHQKFPKFVELKDIKGDMHMHSVYSDGQREVEEMVMACMARGYEYCAMTDHSGSMGITQGLDDKKAKQQWKEIEKINEKLKGKFTVLRGCEVDILKDGALDFSDDILKQLDVVIISAHVHNRLPAEEQTKRLIRAIEHPSSRILGHPTGRLINKRPEMEFDMGKIIKACAANNVIMEINSNPSRLDLPDKYLRGAKDEGVKFIINTDSHDIDQLEFMKFGVGIARRGWLEADDVVNTYNVEKLRKILKAV